MKTLTLRQTEIISIIARLLQQTRFLTVGDLVEQMGLAGESSLMPTLESIAGKGYLTIHRRGKGQSRLLELTTQGLQSAQGLLETQGTTAWRGAAGPATKGLEGTWPGLPVLGTIPAGPLAEAVQEVQEYIHPGSALRWREGDYFLQVDKHNGDSMRGAGILPGAYVLLRPGVVVQSGHIVAALIWSEDHTTCKGTLKRVRLKPDSNTITLEPANPKYKPLRIKAERVNFAGVYQGCVLRPDEPQNDTSRYYDDDTMSL